eukprot:gene29025-32221_t
MCGNGISVVGAIELAAGVGASRSLAAISLDNNDVREEGGQALLKAVEENKGLVACRLDNTNTSQDVRNAIDAILGPRMASQRASHHIGG